MGLTIFFANLYGVVRLIEPFFTQISNLRVVVGKVTELLVSESFYAHMIKSFVIVFYAKYYETVRC